MYRRVTEVLKTYENLLFVTDSKYGIFDNCTWIFNLSLEPQLRSIIREIEDTKKPRTCPQWPGLRGWTNRKNARYIIEYTIYQYNGDDLYEME